MSSGPTQAFQPPSQRASPGAAVGAAAGGPALPSGLVPTEQVARVAALMVPVGGYDARLRRLHRMKRCVMTRARLLGESLRGQAYYAAMVTCTYGPDQEWSPRDISRFTHRARQWMSRRGLKLKYDWVIELTKASRPHYHVLIWLPQLVKLPKPDQAGWWTKGMTRIERIRAAGVGYIAKYASKQFYGDTADGEGMPFPRGARLSGGGGLGTTELAEYRWWLAPRWLRTRVDLQDVRRVTGGYRTASGEHVASPWGFRGHTWRPDVNGLLRRHLVFEPRPVKEASATVRFRP